MSASIEVTIIEELEVAHEQLVGGLRDTFEAALTIGRLLSEQKSRLPHGQFLPWLEKNVTFISESTCRRCMRLHRNRDLLKSVSVTDLTSAYKLLAAPRSEDRHEDDDQVIEASTVDTVSELPTETQSPIQEDAEQQGWSGRQMVEEAKRLNVTPFEAPATVDESELTGDSYNLQQLKHFWRKASSSDKKEFCKWSGNMSCGRGGRQINANEYARMAILQLEKIDRMGTERQAAFGMVASWIRERT
jgi:hypothetical protein